MSLSCQPSRELPSAEDRQPTPGHASFPVGSLHPKTGFWEGIKAFSLVPTEKISERPTSELPTWLAETLLWPHGRILTESCCDRLTPQMLLSRALLNKSLAYNLHLGLLSCNMILCSYYASLPGNFLLHEKISLKPQQLDFPYTGSKAMHVQNGGLLYILNCGLKSLSGELGSLSIATQIHSLGSWRQMSYKQNFRLTRQEKKNSHQIPVLNMRMRKSHSKKLLEKAGPWHFSLEEKWGVNSKKTWPDWNTNIGSAKAGSPLQ